MFNRILYPLLIVILSGFFSTCKKYPEGPLITLRSAEQRLLGRWYVKSYIVDGIDSTVVKYPMQNSITCFYDFSHEGNSISDGCTPTNGSWKFNNKRASLIFYSGGNPPSPLFLSPEIEWTILKLKRNEMHLQVEFNSKKYDFFFKKM